MNDKPSFALGQINHLLNRRDPALSEQRQAADRCCHRKNLGLRLHESLRKRKHYISELKH